MRDELFEYAINTLAYKNPENFNQSMLFGNIASTICMYFVMIVISIPILISNFYLWIISLALWGLMLLFRKSERNAYMKAILIDGMYWIYLAVYLSCILLDFSTPETKTFTKTFLIIITSLLLLVYEIVLLVKIFQKKYTKMKESGFSQDNKEKSNQLITTLSFIGASVGIIFSKIFSISSTTIFEIIFAVAISALWLGGFILIQKYIILKLQKHR